MRGRPADSASLTPDGRYIVVRGRLWRATNPNLGAQERRSLTARLMEARRTVGVAKRKNDGALLRAARQEVQAVKVVWVPTWYSLPTCSAPQRVRTTILEFWNSNAADHERAG